MSAFSWEPGHKSLTDFRRTWPQLLLVSLALRLAIAAILLPSLAFLLRFFVSRTGRAVLSDQEILFFFLTPTGIAALITVGGALIGIGLVEQAGLMTIGLGATQDRHVAWLDALRYVGRRLPLVLLLGAQILLRVLVYVVPSVAVIGGVYFLLLGDADINFYLTDKPPEFVLTVGIGGLVAGIVAVTLGRRALGWILALQMVLFAGLRPPAALTASSGAIAGHRWSILVWGLLWLAAGFAASAIVTATVGWIGRVLIPWDGSSVTVVALLIGGIGLLSLVANLALSFLSAVFFALLTVRLYLVHAGPGELGRPIGAPVGSLAARAQFRVARKGLLWVVAGALAAACVTAVVLVNRVPIQDHAIIMAHRGAAGAAPENTMASVVRALDDHTDYVEIDVQENADGEVVVFHDSDFMKVARNPLKLWEATNADLAKIDIGTWFDPEFSAERVPTLEEVLVAARGRARVNIELKYYGHDVELERKVIEIVESTRSVENVVLMSLKYDKVQKVKAMRPEWTYGVLTSVNLGDAARFDVDFLAINAETASRSLIRRAHRAGLAVYVWTVNDPLHMSAIMSRGVDGIITDEPALARRVLDLRAELDPVQRILVSIGSEVGFITLPKHDLDESDT